MLRTSETGHLASRKSPSERISIPSVERSSGETHGGRPLSGPDYFLRENTREPRHGESGEKGGSSLRLKQVQRRSLSLIVGTASVDR